MTLLFYNLAGLYLTFSLVAGRSVINLIIMRRTKILLDLKEIFRALNETKMSTIKKYGD